jgi:integrase/recombinase XerD
MLQFQESSLRDLRCLQFFFRNDELKALSGSDGQAALSRRDHLTCDRQFEKAVPQTVANLRLKFPECSLQLVFFGFAAFSIYSGHRRIAFFGKHRIYPPLVSSDGVTIIMHFRKRFWTAETHALCLRVVFGSEASSISRSFVSLSTESSTVPAPAVSASIASLEPGSWATIALIVVHCGGGTLPAWMRDRYVGSIPERVAKSRIENPALSLASCSNLGKFSMNSDDRASLCLLGCGYQCSTAFASSDEIGSARTMATIYTRHGAQCPKRGVTEEEKSAAKYERRCNCPKWIYLFHDGKDYRFSAATRSWERAEENKRKVEDSLNPDKAEIRRLKTEQEVQRKPISEAIEEFLSDAEKRNLARETQAKLRRILKRQLLPWAEQNSIVQLDQLTTNPLTKWRSTWLHSPSTSRGRQEILRNFFRFCIAQGWAKENPACKLSRIQVKQTPTGYFPPEEFQKLVEATYVYGERSNNPNAENCAIRIRTLLLLMRCSGLRIGDAVTLERTRLIRNNLSLYQAKTGEPVYVPLPADVAQALRQIPPGVKPNPNYFFWSGNCSAKSAAKMWHHAFRRLFRIADIRQPDGTRKCCHPQMLRDTFAVEMLLAGVPLEKVSVLLGHTSIKTTQKHYAPWVRARQRDLENTVNDAWNRQTIPGMTRAGTVEAIPDGKHDPSHNSQDQTCDAQSSAALTLLEAGAGLARSTRPGQAESQLGHDTRDADATNRPRRKYQRFPHTSVAKMWEQGMAMKEIAIAIGRVDEGDDPYHTVNVALTRMHRVGYKNERGERVKLPYRRQNGRNN